MAQGLNIQAAIRDTNPGDTINVAPGTFTESVAIRTALRLIGTGSGMTINAPPTPCNVLALDGSSCRAVQRVGHQTRK